ncbi:hypothetical protein LTR66_007239 [Elasticomyces elasticus]|nr:hypothetical protein LTR28_000387 [Elasticomyces elasticus]KAK4988714.1 hypothetical protein LTR66_007239 [Elasticomyces elasticus]
MASYAPELQQHVHRISLSSDGTAAFVLLHVSHDRSRAGSRSTTAADLTLVATEGESPYVAHIQQARTHELKDPKSQDSLEEWERLLQSVLLPDAGAGDATARATENVGMIATIAASSMTITIRKTLDGGITQRLGSLILTQDDEQEIQLFDWTVLSCTHSTHLKTELSTLQSSLVMQQGLVKQLQEQLDELIRAKKEHENQLLAKFAELLNAKKLKIRDQQRLLNGAKLAPTIAQKACNARATTPAHTGETFTNKNNRNMPNRKGKRKAAPSPPTPIQEPENGTGVSSAEEEADLEMREAGAVTPDRSDEEATDTEEEDLASVSNSSWAVKGDARARGKAVEAVHGAANGKRRDETNEGGSHAQVEDAPPLRRELPFPRNKGPQEAKSQPATASPSKSVSGNRRGEAAEDDETDDEL